MSYEFKGTRAPWYHSQIVSDTGQMTFKVEARDGCEVCNIPYFDEDAESDARAIAELPILIEVLSGIVKRWDQLVPEEEVSEEHKRARQALAKATGGEG